MTVRFRVLGEVSVDVGGRDVDVGHARQRCVLLALLVDANRVVPLDELVERVWADRPPQRVRGALHTYVSRLRRSLAGCADAVIARHGGGYLLTVDPLTVDLHLFQQLTAQARTAPDDAAAQLFTRALGLWRGEPFGALDSPWLNGIRDTANLWRVAAELDRNDVELRRGRHSELLAELVTGCAARPLDERLVGQLMLALYRCGRQAEALAQYQRTRSRLAEDLGIDPGPGLRTRYQQIVTADRSLDVAGHRGAPPRHLPAPLRSFTGRLAELARLDALVGTAPMAVLSGTAGVGKTTLAVSWAHRVADRFPDGQLYLDLGGFGPPGAATTSDVALLKLLDALGVPARTCRWPRRPRWPAPRPSWCTGCCAN